MAYREVLIVLMLCVGLSGCIGYSKQWTDNDVKQSFYIGFIKATDTSVEMKSPTENIVSFKK